MTLSITKSTITNSPSGGLNDLRISIGKSESGLAYDALRSQNNALNQEKISFEDRSVATSSSDDSNQLSDEHFFETAKKLIDSLNDRHIDNKEKEQKDIQLKHLEDQIKEFIANPNKSSFEKANAHEALMIIETDQELKAMDEQISKFNNKTLKASERKTASQEFEKLQKNYTEKQGNLTLFKNSAQRLWETLHLDAILDVEAFLRPSFDEDLQNITSRLEEQLPKENSTHNKGIKKAFFQKFNNALFNNCLVEKFIQPKIDKNDQDLEVVNDVINNNEAVLKNLKLDAQEANSKKQACEATLQNSKDLLATHKHGLQLLEEKLHVQKQTQDDFSLTNYEKFDTQRTYVNKAADFKRKYTQLGAASEQVQASLANAIKNRQTQFLENLKGKKDETFFRNIANIKIESEDIKTSFEKKQAELIQLKSCLDNSKRQINANKKNPNIPASRIKAREEEIAKSEKNLNFVQQEWESLKNAFTQKNSLFVNELSRLSQEDKAIVDLAKNCILAERLKNKNQSEHDKNLKALILEAPEGFPKEINSQRYSTIAAEAQRKFGQLDAIKSLIDAREKKIHIIADQEKHFNQNKADLEQATQEVQEANSAVKDQERQLKKLNEHKAELEKDKSLNVEKLGMAKALVRISELDK